MADFTTQGHVRGIWALVDWAPPLTVVSPGETFDSAFRRFLLDNVDLYDLRGSTARIPSDLDWLGVPHVSVGVHETTKITRLVYEQSYGTPSISAGQVVAMFIGDKRVSIDGVVVNPSALVRVQKPLSESSARSSAEGEARRVFGSDYTAVEAKLQANLDADHDEYVILLRKKMTTTPASGAFPAGIIVTVEAHTGQVLAMHSAAVEASTAVGSYRVFRPNTTDANPYQPNAVNLSGDVTIDGNTVYPWRDWSSQKTPIVSFSANNVINNQARPFTNNLGNNSFVANPPTSQFALQQASYWLQQASALAEALFPSFPPDEVWRNAPLAVVTEVTNLPNTSSFFDVAGCAATINTFPDSWDGTPCVVHNAASGNNYPATSGGTTIPGLNTLFHEYGHFLDQKYTRPGDPRWYNAIVGACDVGTAEESRSLTETFAGLYGISMFSTIFSNNTPFTDYDGVNSSLHQMNAHGTPVHIDNGSLTCYKTSSNCGANNLYGFGEPFIQAVWESLFARNCFVAPGNPCTNIAQVTGSPIFRARSAIQYTFWSTSRTGTHVSAAANFLSYYYYFVSTGAVWNDRWWIFNHHNLVGPAYGYSPCHTP